MKFETEHGCVVSEMATAYGNSKQIGRYAIAFQKIPCNCGGNE